MLGGPPRMTSQDCHLRFSSIAGASCLTRCTQALGRLTFGNKRSNWTFSLGIISHIHPHLSVKYIYIYKTFCAWIADDSCLETDATLEQDEHNFHKQKTYRKAARPLVKVGVSQPQSDKRALGERLSCSVTAQAPPRCQRHRYKGQLWRIHTRSDSCGGRGLSRFYIEIPEMGGGGCNPST